MNLKKLTWLWFGLIPLVLEILIQITYIVSYIGSEWFDEVLSGWSLIVSLHLLLSTFIMISIPLSLIGLLYQKTKKERKSHIFGGALLGVVGGYIAGIVNMILATSLKLPIDLYRLPEVPLKMFNRFIESLLGLSSDVNMFVVIIGQYPSYALLGAFIVYLLARREKK